MIKGKFSISCRLAVVMGLFVLVSTGGYLRAAPTPWHEQKNIDTQIPKPDRGKPVVDVAAGQYTFEYTPNIIH